MEPSLLWFEPKVSKYKCEQTMGNLDSMVYLCPVSGEEP